MLALEIFVIGLMVKRKEQPSMSIFPNFEIRAMQCASR